MILFSPIVYACADCGSFDIEGTAWIHLNSERVLPDEPPRDIYWCPSCEQEVSLHILHPQASHCACRDGFVTLASDAEMPCPYHGPCRRCSLHLGRCKCSTETA